MGPIALASQSVPTSKQKVYFIFLSAEKTLNIEALVNFNSSSRIPPQPLKILLKLSLGLWLLHGIARDLAKVASQIFL